MTKRQFGLIGFPLSHSKSPEWFKQFFELHTIEDASYDLFPLASIEELPTLFQNPFLLGINVTVPYKQSIIPYLHSLSIEAQAIGAVNCVKIDRKNPDNPLFIGHNTDVIGFEESLKPHLPNTPLKALVFGNGGASLAVQFVLKKLAIPFLVVQRNDGELLYKTLTKQELSSRLLWINTTPVGMYPNINEVLPLDFSAITENHIGYDLVYNPLNTLFLQQISEHGGKCINGLEMLKTQAMAATRIWEL